jgi:branched-subunit amino acid ABC-type transport system permease component
MQQQTLVPPVLAGVAAAAAACLVAFAAPWVWERLAQKPLSQMQFVAAHFAAAAASPAQLQALQQVVGPQLVALKKEQQHAGSPRQGQL